VVDFDTLTFPGHIWDPFMPMPAEAEPATVTATLRLPPGVGEVPGVVITHGCGGAGGGATLWARELVTYGYATLDIDSFRGRGITEICSGQEKLNIASVLNDVFRGLDFLAEHPDVDRSRIALLGLSFGGRTALWANQTRFRDLYGSEHEFVAHLSFYPASCYIRLADEEDVGDAPMRIFHGTADDWLPIEPCREYVERMQAAGRDVALFEYEGALHAFDDHTVGLIPALLLSPLSPRNCAFHEEDGRIIDPETGEVAGVESTCVEAVVTAGYDPEARTQAIEDVTTFLTSVFGDS
jgi:dienelactone hydrolase